MDQHVEHDEPLTRHEPEPAHYDGPAGGWGSVEGIAKILLREKPSIAVLETLTRQNKPGGHMCTSCAWAKPKEPHTFEFCENGAKATIWDLTGDRCTPEFFAAHTVSELRGWPDYELEMQGRLTHPLRYDPASDKYVPTSWNEAFASIGSQLKTFDPKAVVFYSSGRAGLEASYLYALFGRMYGHNNLPDSSNMCHETTSVGLKKVIGSPVGTCVLEDFESCDAIFFFGQNTGSNSPRLLHPLQEAVKRGCRIVTFNPVREKGLLEFVNPQNPAQMLTDHRTPLSSLYLQVRPGGDIAALMGLCKHVFAVHRQRQLEGARPVIDEPFIEAHCHGFEAFRDQAEAMGWEEIEHHSGLARADLEAAANIYVDAEKTIGIYGMGLTQHVHGSKSIGMFVNFLLLKGNIGRDGTGMCPVRGHSNVQGQRTVGISEKPELVPLDKLAELFDFDPPRDGGVTTVDACAGIIDGSIKAFIGLGGNFVRAIPDRDRMEPAWTSMELTVQVATKLNRSHLVNGKSAWLLPCLVRAEEDLQATGAQSVSMEDSCSHIHGSHGKRKPASEHLKSEVAIVAGLAKATLPAHPKWRWDEWTGDYALIRELISKTYPEELHDMNERMWHAGGFYRGNKARERIWKTDSGRAEFTVPEMMSATGVDDAPGRYRLITMRSNDQFNTTIYGYSDRLRGLDGSRDIVLMSPREMERAGLVEGELVALVGDAEDGAHREVGGLKVTPFALPDGCIGGYYPELNALVPLWYHDRDSKTPAAKGVPVRIRKG